MDLRSTLTRAIGWRWMPCVAPVVGALSFVVLCIAIVPDDIGPMSASPASTAAVRDKKTGPEDTPAEPADEESEADGSKELGSRAARRHASPAPAKITTRTTDTVRSMFKGRDGLAAEPLGAEPHGVPPPPGGPAPLVVPESPPLPPVSNLPAGDDPAADPNPDTALPR